MIIVCAWCKEKRKETAKIWHKVDNYATLIKRTSVSHGICPACEKTFFNFFNEGKAEATRPIVEINAPRS